MYEVDFLPVESEDGLGSKSGDAIAIRFTVESSSKEAVVVIDGGFSAIGEKITDHVRQWYGTDRIDLVISTHPDADHLNGLKAIVEACEVVELMVHRPREHAKNIFDFSNIEALDDLITLAIAKGVKVTEPFAGETRFDGQLRILSPTTPYYRDLLSRYLAQLQEGKTAAPTLAKSLVAGGLDLLKKVLSFFPRETLSDNVTTSERNNSSVITLLQCDGRRLLFTGDAGIEALDLAAEEYETLIGDFASNPLHFFQAPHHGSRHNLGPTILDRILGPTESPYGEPTAFISSAKASEKHPSPKVVNALGRRGAKVHATEGRLITHKNGAPMRQGWSTLAPLPPLDEPDDD
jgi:beta-lactamase superfamily II metal-dependent hydrolase